NPSNWQSVLWHEFCHVVTLQMTGNRIPRWLSEGISVYEERRRDARWGQRMTAEFHRRVSDDRITPVAELSGAFLNAESGADLNFAYYQSSMVVEHIVEAHGGETLIAVLQDLNSGVTINDALDRHCGGIEELNTAFVLDLKQKATEWAGAAEFDGAGLAELITENPEQLPEFVLQHPNHVPAGMALAEQLIRDERLDEAVALLRHLAELIPQDNSLSGPRRTLASVYRRQEQTDKELRLLREHVSQNADDLAALLRLQEQAVATDDGDAVVSLGAAIHAIDPFQAEAVIRTAAAAESTGNTAAAADALTTLLQLQPDDSARTHLRLAAILKTTEPNRARRHVLLALEQAPRYRQAHRLLLELGPSPSGDELPVTPAPDDKPTEPPQESDL
ncbi:MAG: hypothetical protein KDA85_11240, partial [Planctomycetaceae bacterium]|nr:hypothetical protein [Planctomycetaceae bacterium]